MTGRSSELGGVAGVDAVVLGRIGLGEADRIVRLLVADRGRVDAVARGARGSRKRFAGALDPGTRLRVTLRRGSASLPWIEEVEVRAAPHVARSTLGRLSLLLWGCEVVAALTSRELEAERLRHLLEVWLDLLEGPQAPEHPQRVAFEGKALTFAGLAPALVRCSVCDRAIEAPAVFHGEAGAAHAACGAGRSVSVEDLVSIERLRRTALADTWGASVSPSARWLLTEFLEYQVGHAIEARAALTWEDP